MLKARTRSSLLPDCVHCDLPHISSGTGIREQIAEAYNQRVTKYDDYVTAFEVRRCAPLHLHTSGPACLASPCPGFVDKTSFFDFQSFVSTSGLPRATDFAGVKKFAAKRAEMLKQVCYRLPHGI